MVSRTTSITFVLLTVLQASFNAEEEHSEDFDFDNAKLERTQQLETLLDDILLLLIVIFLACHG